MYSVLDKPSSKLYIVVWASRDRFEATFAAIACSPTA
jgi:hypothetical protein